MQEITPCLWFDGQAEEATRFYSELIPNSSVDHIERSPLDFPGTKAGDVLAVNFTLAGRPFKALNGGPHFRFNEAVSFVIECSDQPEVDRFWRALSAAPEAERCGWCKDRYGLSWQIVPKRLFDLLADSDHEKSARVATAMMSMKKIDLEVLDRVAGEGT